jgi:ABC-type polysaccharide transport system permease subunit
MNPVQIAIFKILAWIVAYFIVTYILGSVFAFMLGVDPKDEEKANGVIVMFILFPFFLAWVIGSIVERKRRHAQARLLGKDPPDDNPLTYIP